MIEKLKARFAFFEGLYVKMLFCMAILKSPTASVFAKARAMMMVITIAISMIVIGIVLFVALIIEANMTVIIHSYNLGIQGNATAATVSANIYSGLNLLTVVIIVVAAAGVLAGVWLLLPSQSSTTAK